MVRQFGSQVIMGLALLLWTSACQVGEVNFDDVIGGDVNIGLGAGGGTDQGGNDGSGDGTGDGGQGHEGTHEGEFEVIAGGQDYTYAGRAGVSESTGGVGVRIDTATYPDRWPADSPRLVVCASFRGFPENEGFPQPFTVDLSSPDSAEVVSAVLSVSEPDTGIVGDEAEYATYASTGKDIFGGDWVPDSAGRVIVGCFVPLPQQSQAADGTATASSTDWEVDVRFENVVLQKCHGPDMWPDQVTIPSARFLITYN